MYHPTAPFTGKETDIKDITIVIPATGHPNLPNAIQSVKDNGLEYNLWVIWDGHNDSKYAYMGGVHKMVLPENTGRCPISGNVKYYGHRIYSAVSFICNTRWIYFLDEDNVISPDFWAKVSKFLDAQAPDCPAITFRRKIYKQDGSFLGYDDFESVPSNNFADTGCVVWNTKWYAIHASKYALAPQMHDAYMYSAVYMGLGKKSPNHLHEYLLHYTSPAKSLLWFEEGCRKEEL